LFVLAILGLSICQNKQKESTLTGAALISALSRGLDISAWRELKNYERISPQMTAEEAQKIYFTWRQFFDWAIKQVR
jgi:glycerol kinase